MPRFFLLSEVPADGILTITGDDAKHISFSLRMREGERLTVCDGNGTDHLSVIESFQGGAVTVRVLQTEKCAAESPLRLRLYQSVPKGDKSDTIVQKAVELGVSEIIPVYSARCIVRPDRERDEKRVSRLSRIAKEAAMQSGRGIIPRVLPCMRFADALAEPRDGKAFLCYENETAVSLKEYLEAADLKEGGTLSFFVGPEGGYESGEVALAEQCGVPSVGLGRRILRCETASGYVLSAVSHSLGNR